MIRDRRQYIVHGWSSCKGVPRQVLPMPVIVLCALCIFDILLLFSQTLGGDEKKEEEALPVQQHRDLLAEAPRTASDRACLHFDKYAEVLANELKKPTVWPVAVGLYATSGSGKSSLLNGVLGKLDTITPSSDKTPPERIRRRIMNIPIVYALCVVVAVFYRRAFPSAAAVKAPRNDDALVESIVVKFDAWLFSDSDALWANLINDIFTQASSIDRMD